MQSEQLLAEAQRQFARSQSLPSWRWYAIRRAQNRAIFLARLAIDTLRLQTAAPKIDKCPLCEQKWGEQGEYRSAALREP